MKRAHSSSVIEIVFCILLLWAVVLFGASIKMASLYSAEHQKNLIRDGAIYAITSMLCVYAGIGLLFGKKYAWILGNALCLAMVSCAWAQVLISPMLMLPTTFMASLGVLLLFIGRERFSYRKKTYENTSNHQASS